MGNPELEGYRKHFQKFQEQAADLTAGLREDQFNWRPGAGEWSVEECLAHLTMAGQVQVRAIEEAIEKGRRRGLYGNGPFEYGAMERYVVHLAEPPVRLHLSSPKRFIPLHGQPVTAILPTFQHVQSQLQRQTEQAEGLDLRRVKVATPTSRLLKVSLGIMFATVVAHERRHIEQAKRVRARMTS